MQERPPDWRTHGAETIVRDLEKTKELHKARWVKSAVTNVTRVALSCTCRLHRSRWFVNNAG